jgi:reactive chlorine resistance protein C
MGVPPVRQAPARLGPRRPLTDAHAAGATQGANAAPWRMIHREGPAVGVYDCRLCLANGDQGVNCAHTTDTGLRASFRRILGYALWVGDMLPVDWALKFKEYEVQNAEPLVTASPLTSRLREKLGAQKLARIVGVTQITLGSLIAAKPFAPRASAVGSFGAAGMMLSTLSFLVTTPEAWQEGQGVPQLSMLGEALLKDGVLLGAAILTAAESLKAARADKQA